MNAQLPTLRSAPPVRAWPLVQPRARCGADRHQHRRPRTRRRAGPPSRRAGPFSIVSATRPARRPGEERAGEHAHDLEDEPGLERVRRAVAEVGREELVAGARTPGATAWSAQATSADEGARRAEAAAHRSRTRRGARGRGRSRPGTGSCTAARPPRGRLTPAVAATLGVVVAMRSSMLTRVGQWLYWPAETMTKRRASPPSDHQDRRERRVGDAVGDGERLDDERKDDAETDDARPRTRRCTGPPRSSRAARACASVDGSRPTSRRPRRPSSIVRNRLSSQASCSRSAGSGDAQWAKAAPSRGPRRGRAGRGARSTRAAARRARRAGCRCRCRGRRRARSTRSPMARRTADVLGQGPPQRVESGRWANQGARRIEQDAGGEHRVDEQQDPRAPRHRRPGLHREVEPPDVELVAEVEEERQHAERDRAEPQGEEAARGQREGRVRRGDCGGPARGPSPTRP